MRRPRPAGGTRGRLVVLALLLVLAAAVLRLVAPQATGSMTSASPTRAAATTPSTVVAGSPATGLRAGSTPLSASTTGLGTPIAVAGEVPPPVRVRIPSIGVDSSLDALDTTRSGVLEAPPRWQVAGWFSGGVRPGEAGPAVIAGHIDSPTGPAVFAELPDLRPGAVVEVTQRGGHVLRFRVDRTQVAAKDAFPTRAVYGATPDSQLRLITCDGPYVRASGGYQNNLIVYASPEPTRRDRSDR